MTPSSPRLVSKTVQAQGLKLHYVEAGEGPPVILLHGWPTSSFLWRNVMLPMAAHNRVIALDLPGFGKSDKPLDASYSFRFHTRVLDDFTEGLQNTTAPNYAPTPVTGDPAAPIPD